MSGIYLHIPFCKQACSYCDFYFVTRTSEREHFVNRLVEEITNYGDTEYVEEPIKTIYFGGGTPSLLEPEQIERILKAIDEVFELDCREITLEMNPDDVTREFLSDLKSIGINRASMGVQTFQPHLLEFMHRAHTREEALHCLETLSKSQFEVFTVDLIYGNPDQTEKQLEEDLDTFIKFNPPHISAYSLTIEENTRLGKQVEMGRIAPPPDEKVARHFDIVNARLKEHGIQRYEVSNYSLPGHEAVHNSSYWEHENYLGFGPGAHSFWWGEQAMRWSKERDLRSYLRLEAGTEKEKLTLKQLAEERLMMGLRTRKGVGVDELKQKYNYALSEKQREYLRHGEEEGNLTIDDRIVLTDKGIKIADAIVLDLVTHY